ncbi:carbohydrate binding domain-containing protein [Saccharothrix sp. ST-888]|uniref:carbohydrate binding domain-containing protein n=1 Tax=Saccharothrix sp. ST-888 TaxID=1427391 RepID=UPI0005ECF5D6|nr:carbohydrate binding domain-containing protein [Saccharothrix sp. ST-888]
MPRALNRQSAAPHRRTGRVAKLLPIGCAAALAAGALTTVAVNASAADGNLLANPGFESGSLGPWSCSGGTGSVVNSPAHSGSYALQGAASSSDTAQCSQRVSVQPNTKYSLSAWVQGQYVYLGAIGSGVTDPAVWTPGGNSWQQLSTGFTTGPGTTSVTVYLHGWYGQGAYLADDLLLGGPGAPPPTTPPPSSGSPSPSPSPGSSQTQTPPPDVALPVAPYVDMGAWPTPSLKDMAANGNLKSFTMAFITAPSGCKASWFNAYDPRSGWAKDQIDAVRAAGGDVKVSFGGASGTELAQACSTVDSLLAEYDAVVNAYNLRYVDFDIEGTAVVDTAANDRRSAVLARLQQAHPGLKVSLTLPVLPEGLTADGVAVVRSARDAGVNLDLVNVMAMDYNRPSTDYGDDAVQAAQSTHDQLKTLYPARTDAQLWAMTGVTPMLGENDDHGIYDQSAARKLVSFAQQHHLGVLGFWEMTRDAAACTGALFKCTNIPQSPYEFSKIFAQYTG